MDQKMGKNFMKRRGGISQLLTLPAWVRFSALRKFFMRLAPALPMLGDGL